MHKPASSIQHPVSSIQLPTYGIYGFGLSSDFPFANRLAPWSGEPDLSFACQTHPPVTLDWDTLVPLYTSTRRTPEGKSAFQTYQLDNCEVLRLTNITDFYVEADRIRCHLLDPTQKHMVEITLLGTVLSFWLEQRGLLSLHASAVLVQESAIGFMSNSRGGKSSLAAEFVQAGYPLLADDILPVRKKDKGFLAHPGYPTMRMWPTEAAHFLGSWEDLEVVHPDFDKRRVPVGDGGFGAFCDVPHPLTCLYLPERREPHEESEEIEILPLSPAASAIELVRHSFTSRLVEAMGWQERRLALFAQLLAHVPVRRLRYPSGFEHLERTRAAILADQRGLAH